VLDVEGVLRVWHHELHLFLQYEHSAAVYAQT